ncbi:MAG TPA: DUF5615 family PIN-like protein [Candidatus Kapabacteria bacterium]|nr:DUF5615 family PIN-like protein [Candidatus Kapabacteria bacterium]
MAEIRFHLDESVTSKVARALRLQNLDMTTTQEAGLRSSPDESQFEYAKREQRVLITKDTDFLRIASKDWNHSGILYCDPSTTVGQIVLACVTLQSSLSMEDIRGRIEFV